jgi:hypothetical protein
LSARCRLRHVGPHLHDLMICCYTPDYHRVGTSPPKNLNQDLQSPELIVIMRLSCLKNCYCHVETHQKPLKLSPLREILDVRRAKPQSEPPGLDFTQHSPVQRCDSLPILHSKFLDKKGCKITQSCPFCFPLFFFALLADVSGSFTENQILSPPKADEVRADTSSL